jgi:hypothetical protein
MHSSLARVARTAALGAALLCLPRLGLAQDTTTYKNHLYDKFQVAISFTAVLNSGHTRVDGPNGELGTTIDFKEILGISGTSVQPAIGIRWKPGRHTEFDLGYQFINQSGDRSFTDTLYIGEDTVSGDIDASSKLSESNATFQFKYSILAAEKHNIGLALGLGAIFFNFELDATADVCTGTNCTAGTLNSTRKLTVPTGSLGAFGRWRVGDRWYVGVDARGIGGKVDRYKVSVFEGDVMGEYFLSNRWGLALSWFYTNVTVNIDQGSGGSGIGNLAGDISFAYSSIRLGVVGVF